MSRVFFKNLSKQYGPVAAVRDLTLEVTDGEFLVLVGPSGCGKTTVLRCLAGLEEVTGGEIFIGDRCVNEVAPKDRDLAMVFQNYALYPHLSVYENMAFGLRLRLPPTGWIASQVRRAEAHAKNEQIDRRVRAAATMLDLSELLQRRPRELSGGQRQRVALGRAIVREPQVFLMDEPLSNLDANLRVATRAELIRLHRKLGITTLYVTHDQVEAMTMGNRIAVMHQGTLQQCDTPLHLYHQPANRFVAGFIGSPEMNVVEAQLRAEDGNYLVDAGSFTVALPRELADRARGHLGKRVLFGIRPEHIQDRELSTLPVNGNVVDVKVDVMEPMGASILFTLTAGPHSLVASFDPATRAREQESWQVVFNMKHAHLFEMETGRAVL